MKPLKLVVLLIILISCKEPSLTHTRIDLEADGKVVFSNLLQNTRDLRLSFGDYSLDIKPFLY